MLFRKKPVVIDATPFDPALFPWPDGVRVNNTAEGYVIFDSAQNGDVPVNPGDWIITGVQGERYPCKSDIFAATYEPALSADAVREDVDAVTG